MISFILLVMGIVWLVGSTLSLVIVVWERSSRLMFPPEKVSRWLVTSVIGSGMSIWLSTITTACLWGVSGIFLSIVLFLIKQHKKAVMRSFRWP